MLRRTEMGFSVLHVCWQATVLFSVIQHAAGFTALAPALGRPWHAHPPFRVSITGGHSRLFGVTSKRASDNTIMLAKGGKTKKKPGTVAENRQAKFNYQIAEKFECGMVLFGTEVKSCRAGKVQIAEGYVRVDKDGQLKLYNCNIAKHDHTGSVFNHEERRPRVLLAHKSEISQILKRQEQKGGTCVPLRVYFNDIGFLKCEIATCSGKKLKDKKDDLKGRDIARDTKREMKSMGY